MLSAFKNFGVTFLISLVIFGIIAFFATGFITGTIDDILTGEREGLDSIISNDSRDTDTAPGPDAPDENEIYGDSFNVLFITTDYRPEKYGDYMPSLYTLQNTPWNESDPVTLMGYLSREYRENCVSSIVFVRFDKEEEAVIYSYLSPFARVFTEYGYKTLSEVFKLYGRDKLTEYIYAMTGCTIDYSFVLQGYNMDEFEQLSGTGGISLRSNIYDAGLYNTFRKSTDVKVTEGGTEKTITQNHAYLLGGGYVSFTGENLYNTLAVREDSMADLGEKQTIAVDTAKSYISYFASLDEYTLKCRILQLIYADNTWYSIESTAASAAVPADYPDEPVNYGTYTVLYPYGSPSWEPYDSVVSTNFTINDFYKVYSILKNSSSFTAKTISCPYIYHPATDDLGSFFDYSHDKGVKLFTNYRGTKQY